MSYQHKAVVIHVSNPGPRHRRLYRETEDHYSCVPKMSCPESQMFWRPALLELSPR
jgi:hypothetical protein